MDLYLAGWLDDLPGYVGLDIPQVVNWVEETFNPGHGQRVHIPTRDLARRISLPEVHAPVELRDAECEFRSDRVIHKGLTVEEMPDSLEQLGDYEADRRD